MTTEYPIRPSRWFETTWLFTITIIRRIRWVISVCGKHLGRLTELPGAF